MEILKGYDQLERYADLDIDTIFHPIGTGMFSVEQFNEWVNEAIRISDKYNTTLIGTSHADGSYQNCGVSIPISYVIKKGQVVFISQNDTRSRIYDSKTDNVYLCEQEVIDSHTLKD